MNSQQILQILNNPNLTPEQKQTILNQLSAQEQAPMPNQYPAFQQPKTQFSNSQFSQHSITPKQVKPSFRTRIRPRGVNIQRQRTNIKRIAQNISLVLLIIFAIWFAFGMGGG